MYNTNKESDLKLNTDAIKSNLLNDGGLCPSCEKRINEKSMLASFFTSDNNTYYYLICSKCLHVLNKVDEQLKNNKKKLIEKRLIENIHPYAALLIYQETLLNKEKEEQISVLKDNSAQWVLDDKEFFKKNPASKFRYRQSYLGELEETYTDKPHLAEDSKNKNISCVIVHNLENGQTIKSFLNDISDNYPVHEANFVAALFIVLINKIDPEKIMDIYKDINERKKIFNGLDSLKVNY